MAEPPIAAPISPPAPAPTTLPLHTPPAPFALSSLTPITQGAEALVYKTFYLSPSTPALLKYRPPKPYRHATLDKRLTKQRLLAEARSLNRVKRGGVRVPGVLGADWDQGWLMLEWVEGATVRSVLDSWAKKKTQAQSERGEKDQRHDAAIKHLMHRVGCQVGKLHGLGVCHGDLTTSNIMLRTPAEKDKEDEELAGDVYLIDFGLTSASIADEDKAVDLYVLERAFSATHPAAEPLFQEVLRAYATTGSDGGRAARSVLKRLEGVRLRGRKRSMLG